MSKICITVTNDLLQDQRMHRVAQTLHEAGHEVSMIGRRRKNSLPKPDAEYAQHRITCLLESGVGFYIEYNLRLIAYLWRNRNDVVYAVDLDTLIAGYLGSRFSRSKLIHDAHEYFIAVPELNNSMLKKKIWDLVGKSLVKKTDLAITVNEDLAKVLGERYHKKFEVIRSVPAIKDIELVADLPTTKKIILYQGMLNKGRGLETAIRAAASMDRDIVLQIVGEGDLSLELRVLATSVDMHGSVQFLGWKTPAQMRRITSTAWLGLNLLSADSLNYKYSLANKFFDYMHAGVPSVNMDFPVYRRYIDADPVGVCLPDLEVDTLIDVLEMLMDTPRLYNQMKAATVIAKTKYNWQIESQHLLSLLHSIIDE